MPKYVIATPQITVNSVNLSGFLTEVTLTYEADELDLTSSGTAVADKSFIAGLRSWKIDATLHQDYAAATVDPTLFPLVGAAAFPVLLRPTVAARSATNPEFSGSCILTSYPPMSGAVGEVATTRISMRGTGALSRLTA